MLNSVISTHKNSIRKYTRFLGYGSGTLFNAIFEGDLDGARYLLALEELRLELQNGMSLRQDGVVPTDLSALNRDSTVQEVLTQIMLYAAGNKSAEQYLRQLVADEIGCKSENVLGFKLSNTELKNYG